MKFMLIRRELSELRQNYFTVKKMRDFPKKKKKKRAAPLSSDKGSKGLIKLKDWQAALC